MQFHSLNRNLNGIFLWITINACRNQRKCNCLKVFFLCKIQRVFIAGSQKCFSFSRSMFVINRTNSMNYKSRWKFIAFCDFSFAGPAAVKSTAFSKKFRTCCIMNGTINTSATKKAGICSIYDYITS